MTTLLATILNFSFSLVVRDLFKICEESDVDTLFKIATGFAFAVNILFWILLYPA